MLGEADVERHSAVLSFGRFDTNQQDQQGQCSDISTVDGDLIWKMMKVCCKFFQQKNYSKFN